MAEAEAEAEAEAQAEKEAEAEAEAVPSLRGKTTRRCSLNCNLHTMPPQRYCRLDSEH